MAEGAYIGAIDQGTTSTRFMVYNSKAHIVASHQVEFTQIMPEAGWVEHDPMEILDTVRVCMEETLKKVGPEVIAGLRGIGITNQRETTVVWSKSSGRPLHNAIVWMDVRSAPICRRLEAELTGGARHFVATAGLPISTYFSATKLLWLMDSVPLVREAIDRGDALFGTIDSWLIWNLTGGARGGLHLTDCSNAARTLLMDLKSLQWHRPTLESLGIPLALLPRIISNSEVMGAVAAGWPAAGVPLAGCLGDQHAATLGQQCKKGHAKSTYGTGCFILLNTGDEIVPSEHGLLTTVGFKLGREAPTNYALEGSIAIAGAAVQWLRDNLQLISKASDTEALAASVPDTGGLYFVPAFGGLFAPWWRDDARGVLVGISRFTGKAHVARATLESMCFQARAVLTAMKSDMKSRHKAGDEEFLLRVDGGASANNLLMQLQADILGAAVLRPADIETTALGAAYAAGLAVGVWTEEQIFEDNHEFAKPTTFTPQIDEESRERRYKSWNLAVERSFGLADLAL
ncbi:glycerol kinase [Marchantia polymorpha subsp. ruderalis]|uniref:glycerol kinase n=2 Tax=Marchantia polymorpha TaxID=3197 RepID=A0AAF6B1J7_MARPO|nr:hypothetical protein MARPO_0004s0005 [Marchantia polymorpha]BBN05881.1 hypothetical protein Mp_3g16660 [Marchantia polymorpha subsp. ruderalis]|eukprot:PTQ48695.1 hypothetical protein MARPO_0004s0005 [Marchantia polymorpha]